MESIQKADDSRKVGDYQKVNDNKMDDSQNVDDQKMDDSQNVDKQKVDKQKVDDQKVDDQKMDDSQNVDKQKVDEQKVDDSLKHEPHGADEQNLPPPPKFGAKTLSRAQQGMQHVIADIEKEAQTFRNNGQPWHSTLALAYALKDIDIDREHQLLESDPLTTEGSRYTKLKMIEVLYKATNELNLKEMVSVLYYMHLLMRDVRTNLLGLDMGDGFWKEGKIGWADEDPTYFERYDEEDHAKTKKRKRGSEIEGIHD